MYQIDPNLEQYSTPRQWEVLTALKDQGSERTAAKALGVDKAYISKVKAAVLKKAAAYGYSPDHDMIHCAAPGFRVKGTSTLYDMQTGDARMQWVKTTADQERQEQIQRELVEELCSSLPKIKPVKQSKFGRDDLLAVIPFGDPHFGMYSWAEETGNDFNLDIARRDLCAAVDHLVRLSTANRLLIANLGDFFHADNLEGKTARSGNVLDMDTRLPKVIRVGVAAMRQCIETGLKTHQTVEVVNAIGNHDDVLSMALAIMLANIYEKEPRVVIHDQPTPRHYIRHGKTLIGITHGHRTKDRDLPGIMATERAADWGETRHRYFYRGHHHHDSLDEFNGCKVEQFRTLAPGDAWAVGGGYLSGRDMKMIIHHNEYGEWARHICSIDLLGDVA